jgi:tellurite resistance protein TerC
VTIGVWEWTVFSVVVVVLLALDLLVFHRRDHEPKLRESAWWTVFWIGVGLAFNVFVWAWHAAMEGPAKGTEVGVKFLTAYVSEKALSMDNIFVFVVIFRFFAVPLMYQYRVLFWGILGAIFMRLTFILAGLELIHMFDWVVPVFGGILIFTGYRLLRHDGTEVHPENNFVLRVARRWLRVSRGDHHQHGHSFFVREDGRLCITPMFLALLVIESTDVIFAVDSVPLVIGITKDRFIAFSSNVFAILGLRALYFLLAGSVDRFRYLHYGLAAVLVFVGGKMLAEYWVHDTNWELPHWASLLVVLGLIAVSIAASLMIKEKKEE